MTELQGGMHRIVVGVDESDGAQAALRWAVREAHLRGVTLAAVSAWSFPVPLGFPYAEIQGVASVDFHARAEATLATAVEKALADEGVHVPVESRVVMSHPVAALTKAAEGADLLVVGARGRGGFAGLLLGSVSRACAEHATCPVVIVPHAH
jgi:nucleotide-binding universal stress UspA family protein